LDVPVAKGKSVDLSIISIDKVRPHEEVIPILLRAIMDDMRASGVQRDPILIDSNSGIILDGMHRHAALKELGAKLAVCSQFDYESSNVKLERWLRFFPANDAEFLDMVVQAFEFEKSSASEAIEAVDLQKSPVALLSERQSFVSKLEVDLELVYSKLSDFDKLASKRQIEISFLEESSVRNKFDGYVIYPMLIQKNDVRSMVRREKVFPHKTTRHTLPLRPLNVCFPLTLLREGSLERSEAKLRDIVGSAKPALLKERTLYNGRQYSEPVAVIISD
jgi:L-serine kinase (ADP)